MIDTDKVETIYFSQERDFWGNLKRDLQELRGISTLVYELIQNADDVKTLTDQPGGAHQVSFDVRDEGLVVENDGLFSDCGQLIEDECSWKNNRGHRCDFHRMKQVGGGDKRNQSENTGAFGIGFNAVYQITDHPEIISNGWHWQIHPERDRDKRILANRRDNTVGTRFMLPWAFDLDSEVRQILKGCPAIQHKQIESFVKEIQNALPKAAIFLKQINSLKLYRNGNIVSEIDRREVGKRIELIIDGQKTTWQVFRDDFKEEANKLREKYAKGAIEETRRSNVAIAVPDSLFVQGFLFANLPTEMSTNLPFHIEADFYPSSDRKRILLDDGISGEWNRLAIHSAAKLTLKSFDEIIKLFPEIELWNWIAQIYKAGKEAPIDYSCEAFWDNLSSVLPHKIILVTTKNEKTFINSACLLGSDEERDATAIWEDLGIKVVHPDLRKHYNLLRELGTPQLRLSDITNGLKTTGLIEQFTFDQVPHSLQSITDFQKMWKAINLIWNNRSNRSSEEDRKIASCELMSCSIAVGTDDEIYIPQNLNRGDLLGQQIFPGLLGWLKELPDSDPIPTSLVEPFSVSRAVLLLNYLTSDEFEPGFELFWQGSGFILDNFYQWLENRRDEVQNDTSLIDELRELAIWPAGGHVHPLTNLYLPGDFEDPLGLASIIDLTALGGRYEFLRDVLKVKTLDFPTYIREKIPPVFNNDNQQAELCRKLVIQLAIKLEQIRDSTDIKYILRKLPLVECQDGKFYPASMVYFDNEVNRVLGGELKLAQKHKEKASSIDLLYDWLGVARRPRDEDIMTRIRGITTQAPTIENRKSIEALFTYLSQRWKAIAETDNADKNQFEQNFNPLKRLRWLPGSRNLDQWFSPDTLYVSFNKYVFESQGNFLDFPLPIQSNAINFLEFLVININPLPILIVRHILYCSENRIAVNWEVYRFLSRKEALAEEQTLEELEGKACILVCEDPVQYMRPDQVFWNDHPFGSYRYKLGPGLRAYEELFSRLGIRPDPEIRDYIQVLLDISNQFGNNPLDEITLGVVMCCWQKLSEALSASQISPEDLKAKLCHQRVIPNPRQVLTVPEHLFFEDRAGLAARFETLLKNNVIQRMEGCWLAMETVGVQLLSRLIKVDLAKEVESTPDDDLYDLILERMLLIQRIIDSEQTAGSELSGREKLLSLDFQRATDLEIKMTIHVFNKTYQTEPEKAKAVLLKDNIFFSIWTYDMPSWPAIGRELALALKPSGEIGNLAMGIKEVLSASSFQEASDSLDELSFPPLQEIQEFPEVENPIVDLPPEDPLAAILDSWDPDRPDVPATDPEDPNLGGRSRKGSSNTKPKSRRRTSRILSYVYPDDALLPSGERSGTDVHKRTVTEQSGIEIVIENEEKYHRDAIDKNKETRNHPGYDLESTDQETGVVRYIEVKSLSSTWDSTNPIMMTKNEFEMAKAKGDEYWLYIVEMATSDDHQIYRIQNPANRANYFVFDHGWEPLAFSERL